MLEVEILILQSGRQLNAGIVTCGKFQVISWPVAITNEEPGRITDHAQTPWEISKRKRTSSNTKETVLHLKEILDWSSQVRRNRSRPKIRKTIQEELSEIDQNLKRSRTAKCG